MKARQESSRNEDQPCELMPLITVHQDGEELIFWSSTLHIGGHVTKKSWWYNRINYYQEGSLVHPQLDVSTAFRKALKTWASWVDKSINPRKTQVFFRSSAPSHFQGRPMEFWGTLQGSNKSS